MVVWVVLGFVAVVLAALVLNHRRRVQASEHALHVAPSDRSFAGDGGLPRRPDIQFAARGFKDIMINRRNNIGGDLERYASGSAELMLKEGATIEQALSAQCGGLLAIHADLALYQDALDAYAATKKELGRDPYEGADKDKTAKFSVASSMLIGTELALRPDEYERFLRHVGR